MAMMDVLRTRTGKVLAGIAAAATLTAGGLGLYSLKQHNELEQAKPKIELADSVMGETTSIPDALFSYNPKANTISFKGKLDEVEPKIRLANSVIAVGTSNPNKLFTYNPKDNNISVRDFFEVEYDENKISLEKANLSLKENKDLLAQANSDLGLCNGKVKSLEERLSTTPKPTPSSKVASSPKAAAASPSAVSFNPIQVTKQGAEYTLTTDVQGMAPGAKGILYLPGVGKQILDIGPDGKFTYKTDSFDKKNLKGAYFAVDNNPIDKELDASLVYKAGKPGRPGLFGDLSKLEGIVNPEMKAVVDSYESGKANFRFDTINQDVARTTHSSVIELRLDANGNGKIDSDEVFKGPLDGDGNVKPYHAKGVPVPLDSFDGFVGSASLTLFDKEGKIVYQASGKDVFKDGEVSKLKPEAGAPEAGALGAAPEAGAPGEGAKIHKSKVSRHLTLVGGNETSLTLGVEAVDKSLRFDAWAKAYLNDRSSAKRTLYSLKGTTEPSDGTYFESNKFGYNTREVERLGAFGAGVSKGFFDDSFRLGVGAGAAYNKVNKSHTVGESGQSYRDGTVVGDSLFGEVTTKDSDRRTLEGFLRGSANVPLGGGFSLNAAADVYKNGSDLSAGLGYKVPESVMPGTSLSLGYSNARNNEGSPNVRKEGVNAGLNVKFLKW